MMDEKLEMEAGKIYYITYGGNTQLIVRFKESDVCDHLVFDYLHYWNGYESFYKNDRITKSGITEIRRATKAEKHALIRFEIEHETI